MRDGGRVAHDVANIRLVGGTPPIDFVNSIHDRTSEFAQDYLLDGAAYLDWCVRAGVLTAAERRLVAEREADEVVAGDVPMLRAAMHALFTSVSGEPPAGESAAAGLDRWRHLSWAGLHLDSRSLGRLVHDAPPDASLPLQRLALSGLDTLHDVDPRRLKRCSRWRCSPPWSLSTLSRTGAISSWMRASPGSRPPRSLWHFGPAPCWW